MINYSCDVYTPFYQYRHRLYESFVASSVLLGLQIIPAVIFNLSILLVIWKTPTLQSPSYLFLFNLAVSDLAIAIVGSPSVIFNLMSHVYELDHQLICISVYSCCVLSSIFSSVSFLTITAATVDRYLALKLHLSYAARVTTFRVVGVCGFMWLFCIAISSLLIVSIQLYCLIVFPTLLFCLSLMVFCYCKILIVIRHHHKQIQCQLNPSQVKEPPLQNMSRFKKSTYNILLVFALSILLYSPVVIGLLALVFNENVFMNGLRFFVLVFPFVFMNSTLNPLLYCWRLTDIRQALKQKWRQLCCRNS
ncbi:melanocyte-stimulating hormone receptor-like [Exaiptasia diaphana]|uniref:G-protein coupled receptors family 1 profile domain-containing protein n=1 Tax=Exaiptasia diaphana TaxID=2652724 RepID=A0A913YGM8_EXADI|nr:melanocyte-stimulating hormone receptor-like [Exaiptasia diaphana]